MNLFKDIESFNPHKQNIAVFLLILVSLGAIASVLHEFGHVIGCVVSGNEFVGLDFSEPNSSCLVTGNSFWFCAGGLIVNLLLGLLIFSRNKLLQLFGFVNLVSIPINFLLSNDLQCVMGSMI